MTPRELLAREAGLVTRWRSEAELFRRRGAAEAAATLEDCAAELEALGGGQIQHGNGVEPRETAEPMLTAKHVASLLGTSERWVYDHADQLGGKRLSRRTLRFAQAAVRRWLERRS